MYYTSKFLRDINFDVFAGILSSTKFKSSKFYKTVAIHLKHMQGKTHANKIAEILDLDRPRNLHPSKFCTYTVLLYSYTAMHIASISYAYT